MRILIGVLIGVIVLLSFAVVGQSNLAVQHDKQLVWDACNQSRQTDTVSEDTCGYLQDKFNMEYLCKNANSFADNYCWVEV